ncbi:hypothetical protein C8Q80DRAFT_1195420 [Daedaleopsis nitida]|nr:hypothetical protein C8Q80DRAFT_1195420 [Daedaleopsis nitida]
MVVTRRTPAPPTASRTSSAQPIPRLAKKASPDSLNTTDKSSPLVNGTTHDASAQSDTAHVDTSVSVSERGLTCHMRRAVASVPC